MAAEVAATPPEMAALVAAVPRNVAAQVAATGQKMAATIAPALTMLSIVAHRRHNRHSTLSQSPGTIGP